MAGGVCDLRPGYRLRLMVRDMQGVREGLRDAMLRFKRDDLGAMVGVGWGNPGPGAGPPQELPLSDCT